MFNRNDDTVSLLSSELGPLFQSSLGLSNSGINVSFSQKLVSNPVRRRSSVPQEFAVGQWPKYVRKQRNAIYPHHAYPVRTIIPS